MSEYENREDGQAYASPVVAEAVCAYCGASIAQRREGRPRKFCDSTCRSGAFRRSKITRRVKSGAKKVERR